MNTAQIFFSIEDGKFKIKESHESLNLGIHRIHVHKSIVVNGTMGNDLTVVFIEILNEPEMNGTIQ